MGSYMVSKVMQDLASMGSACGAVSGAGAAAARPLIDENNPAGAAQLAPMAPWYDGALGFV